MSGGITRTAQEHCDILWQWLDLIVAETARRKEAGQSQPHDHLEVVAEHEQSIRIAVGKSNYLSRRLYAGESHRITPCPIHKGHWSGYAHPDPCPEGCSLGIYDITGWLPAPDAPGCERCEHPSGLHVGVTTIDPARVRSGWALSVDSCTVQGCLCKREELRRTSSSSGLQDGSAPE